MAAIEKQNIEIKLITVRGLIDSMAESNHQLFLQETLWEFSRHSVVTDLVFVCKDQQKVAAHKAILSRYPCGAKLFSLSPLLTGDTTNNPGLVIVPDWTKLEVRRIDNFSS